MYLPTHFAETEAQRLLALMKSDSFGLLIHTGQAVPTVSHLPFLIQEGSPLRLLCHLARANTQWQTIQKQPRVLVVFQGPHCYVSPSWYQQEGVPTWNYCAVHCTGTARIIDQKEQKRQLVEALTATHEQHQSAPWPIQYPAAMLQAIVGLEITVEDIQGKFKLSQNRPVVDRLGVIEALQDSGDENSHAVATMMQEEETKNIQQKG